MNVRIASATTIRSGVITSRTETASRSRRMSCIATRFATSPWTSPITSSSGSRRSRNARASGRAAASSCVSRPISLPSHQRAASGNESSRSVSPVGAQSTTITSHSPSSTWRLSRSRLNSSSPPGGTVSSSAAIRSTPRSTSTWPSQPCTADQWRSSSSCAETCWAHRFGASSVGSLADRRLEHVGERVRRIGGEHDRAQPGGGAAAGGGGGDRRLADAALARVEDRARGHRAPRSLLRLRGASA